jgi:tripartite-type tricarboxylate transporter receptor subunit TctC
MQGKSFLRTRRTGSILLSALALGLGSSWAQTDKFPEKPVKIIVAVSAGGSQDKLARTIAPKLSAKWGQSVVVENIPGGSSSIGTAQGVRARPDGYTLLMGSDQIAIDVALGRRLPYDSLKDLRGITKAVVNPQLLLVRPGLGVKTLDEFVALAHEKPGSITIGIPGGAGSFQHLALEMLDRQLGIQTNNIPYPGGGPILLDMLGGHLDATLITLAAATGHVRDHTLIPLGVTTPTRSKALPEVPTLQELGVKDYAIATWQGFVATRKVPDALVQKLYQDIAAVLKDPVINRQLEEAGYNVVAGTPEELDRDIAEDIQTFSRVAKESGIKLE